MSEPTYGRCSNCGGDILSDHVCIHKLSTVFTLPAKPDALALLRRVAGCEARPDNSMPTSVDGYFVYMPRDLFDAIQARAKEKP